MSDDTKTTELVSLVDLINRLAEPPEPAPISMVPQTAGWAVVGLALVVTVIWLSLRWYRRWRDNAYRRAALSEIGACGDNPVKIADILRRTALVAFPRENVASLTGTDWLAFLDRTGGEGEFEKGVGKIILFAPYQSRPMEAAPGLQELAAKWIRRHDASAAGQQP